MRDGRDMRRKEGKFREEGERKRGSERRKGKKEMDDEAKQKVG